METSTFITSVSDMYNLCGDPVAVDTVSNRTICGNIYTIDPITQSVVIIVFTTTGEVKSVKVISGQAIRSIRIFGNDHNLPVGCLKRTPELEIWFGSLLKVAPLSRKRITARKKKLVNWLERNRIQVTHHDDGSISLYGAVRIVEPFTVDDCFSHNVIILERMKRLIARLDGRI